MWRISSHYKKAWSLEGDKWISSCPPEILTHSSPTHEIHWERAQGSLTLSHPLFPTPLYPAAAQGTIPVPSPAPTAGKPAHRRRARGCSRPGAQHVPRDRAAPCCCAIAAVLEPASLGCEEHVQPLAYNLQHDLPHFHVGHPFPPVLPSMGTSFIHLLWAVRWSCVLLWHEMYTWFLGC